MTLEGKRALIVGGSGTLGREIARRLATEGSDVVLTYRKGRDRAAEASFALRDLGVSADSVQMDVRDPDSVEEGIESSVQMLGGLDILINAAGVARNETPVAPGDIEGFTPDAFDGLIASNLRGAFLTSRAAYRHLRQDDGGRVVNIGSTIALGRWGAIYPYSIAKAAVVPLTRYLAESMGPDVLVNCVAPGLMEGTGLSTGASEEYVAHWQGAAAAQVTTDKGDVAEQVLTLCRSSSTTGQTIIVDGGLNFR